MADRRGARSLAAHDVALHCRSHPGDCCRFRRTDSYRDEGQQGPLVVSNPRAKAHREGDNWMARPMAADRRAASRISVTTRLVSSDDGPSDVIRPAITASK